MNLRNAMIIGSIGLASLMGCKDPNTYSVSPSNNIGSVPIGYQSDSTIATGDINNDGMVDFVITSRASKDYAPNTIIAFINNGDESFTRNPLLLLPTGYRSANPIALADVDNDNDLDIIAGSRRAEDGASLEVYLFKNDGNGNFK